MNRSTAPRSRISNSSISQSSVEFLRGTVLIGEERVDAVSESEWIEDGTPVRVVASEGYRHVVRPLRKLEDASTDKGEKSGQG